MNTYIQKLPLGIYRILALFGIYGGLSVSYVHFTTSNGCPVLFSFLPACYLIAGVFCILFALSFMSYKKTLLGILLFGCIFATFASVSNISGIGQCPISGGGTPMCYIAMSLFVLMIICYFLERRNNK